MIPLSELDMGKVARVRRVGGGYDFMRRLMSLGIRLDQIVVKVGSGPFKSPIVIEVDRAKVAIGRGMALNVFVEELQV